MTNAPPHTAAKKPSVWGVQNSCRRGMNIMREYLEGRKQTELVPGEWKNILDADKRYFVALFGMNLKDKPDYFKEWEQLAHYDTTNFWDNILTIIDGQNLLGAKDEVMLDDDPVSRARRELSGPLPDASLVQNPPLTGHAIRNARKSIEVIVLYDLSDDNDLERWTAFDERERMRATAQCIAHHVFISKKLKGGRVSNSVN